jgi:Tol biopolymer transport system component
MRSGLGRGQAAGIGIGVLVLALGAAATSAGAATEPSVVRVNVSSTGAEANDGLIDKPVLSADGRFVAFASGASNLVPGDTNGYYDIFLRDRAQGTTTRISVSSSGGQSNGASFAPAISADGRYVAYDSYGSNLVSGDGANSDVFLYDTVTRTTVKVSRSTNGGSANGESAFASISADGRYVAYDSTASNIVSGDSNAHGDVFRFDRTTGQTVRVSLRNGGTQSGTGAGGLASMSADGSKIAFVSSSTDLVSGDTNGYTDVYVRDLVAGTTTRASLKSDGTQGFDDVEDVSISADGTHVAFNMGWNLVPEDKNWDQDVYVRDLTTGTTTWASAPAADSTAPADSRGMSYGASLSGDGRYVAFTSFANDLLDGDLFPYQEVYLRDTADGSVTRIARNSAGLFGSASSYGPSVSPDGAHIAFGAAADNLVALDSNNSDDVFVYEPGGNAFPTPVVVDTTAPNTTITSGPASSIRTSTATFAFTSTEAGSTFQCRLDTAAWASCTSPKTVSVARGKHTMNVRAIDAAGNVDATPAVWSFSVK